MTAQDPMASWVFGKKYDEAVTTRVTREGERQQSAAFLPKLTDPAFPFGKKSMPSLFASFARDLNQGNCTKKRSRDIFILFELLSCKTIYMLRLHKIYSRPFLIWEFRLC